GGRAFRACARRSGGALVKGRRQMGALDGITGGMNAPLKEARPAKRMALGAVTKGKIAKAQRIVIYGTEGIGKSTFGACAPSPIFLCSENGTEHLDVARFPAPQSWRDVLDAVDVLINDD